MSGQLRRLRRSRQQQRPKAGEVGLSAWRLLCLLLLGVSINRPQDTNRKIGQRWSRAEVPPHKLQWCLCIPAVTSHQGIPALLLHCLLHCCCNVSACCCADHVPVAAGQGFVLMRGLCTAAVSHTVAVLYLHGCWS
jgi:hypothetical protein